MVGFLFKRKGLFFSSFAVLFYFVFALLENDEAWESQTIAT